MPNRLKDALSPYLLQHAHNPVDWHPWGEEALARAKAEDKPIFLSIGYAACHWCHVMERESFENEAVAQVLNAHFVCIKVDREERPDLDDLYMDAVQTLTGRGGWPMSVWLTPDLKPFYGGTYFPPESRGGMPGFRLLLLRIAELWRDQRLDVAKQAAELTEELARQAQIQPGQAMPDGAVFARALAQLRASFDAAWGGFGPAPKFPPSTTLGLILRRGTPEDRRMARRTLDAMRDGGMHDWLGGGFARYSVDTRWLVPHFEKMLYDNAQLAVAYLEAFQAEGDPSDAAVVRATLDYLLRDLRDEAGGFHASEDADSEGEEGKFYVFTPAEAREALGEEAEAFCAAYGITEEGNFEHGASVAHRFSAKAALPAEDDARLRERLRVWRDRRVRPAKDDKVVAAWNGLTISAFAKAAAVLDEPRYFDAATACAIFIERELWKGDHLLRIWRGGQAATPGFLEDYAAVAAGLADLFEAGFDARWLRLAERVAEAMRARFEDPEEGGFFATETGQGDMLIRLKPGFDNALPSGNTLAANALIRLSRHLEREDFRNSAEKTLTCFGPWMDRAPRAFPGMLGALDFALSEPMEIVIAGGLSHPAAKSLLKEVRSRFLPNAVTSCAEAGSELPLHRSRGLLKGEPCAFVCRNRTCSAPVSTPDALASLLL
ncbi:MAG TPA: thioredoxin domain-containing protein [Holophagaceae bacterium]|nr:thioredoxin domain-containing protein [Holophagaceae bacterium]